MMELELKHLAPYLPYGLEIINNVNKKRELTIYYLNYWKESGVELKPILRPLSDLTKEIKHDGDKFTPCTDYYYIKDELEELSALDSSYIRYTRYNVVKVLFELHFDFFGLIEKGLAIDINTLT